MPCPFRVHLLMFVFECLDIYFFVLIHPNKGYNKRAQGDLRLGLT